MHIVAKTGQPRTLTVYSKFGFVFKSEAFPKGIRRAHCFPFFWGGPVTTVGIHLWKVLWLSENCSVSMFDAETIPEEFYLAP